MMNVHDVRSGRSYLRLLTMVLVLLAATSAQALTWNITQLTDNNFDDLEAQVSGDNVVWLRDDGTDNDVIFYDGLSETALTIDSLDDKNVQISGSHVVWEGYDGNDWEVFSFDGSTTTQMTNNNYGDGAVRVSGDNMTWVTSDGNDSEIAFYDGVSTTLISNNNLTDTAPEISGDKVVWQTYNEDFDPTWDIYMYDGSTTSLLFGTTDDEEDPKISGNNVLYRNSSSGLLKMYDGTTTTVLDSLPGWDWSYEIAGDQAAWHWDGDLDPEVHHYDGTTASKVSGSITTTNTNPQLSEEVVAWTYLNYSEGTDFEIMAYDGVSTTLLSDNSVDDTDVAVDGTTIVWSQWDGNDYEIMMATAQNLCIIGDANCDGYVDIQGDILPAFGCFTGPGYPGFEITRACGDVHGDAIGATPDLDPHDGDVDVQDLLTMFGAFTGPPPDEAEADEAGLVAAEAGDPSVPDLIYDPVTGEVVLDADGAGIIGYVLKNGDGTFVSGNHTPILAGVSTSLASELSEAAFASASGSIGFVFPTGMDLAALTAYLTTNEVSPSLGAPVVPFDLVELSTGPAVPEPATVMLSLVALVGLAAIAVKRRRRV